MESKLSILVCGNFHREAAAVCSELGAQEVVIRAFPATCNRPPIDWAAVANQLGQSPSHHVDLIGGIPCARAASASDHLVGCRVHEFGQCFNMLLNSQIADHYVKAGAYLVTPGWLTDWREHLIEWGFDQEGARHFFGEFASKLLLLDTGIDTASHGRLAEMAEFTGLPFEVLPIGLDHMRLLLANVLKQRQHEYERERSTAALADANRRMADYAATFAIFGTMARANTENEAIQSIFDVFASLFAPASMIYTPFVGDEAGLPQSRGEKWQPATLASDRIASFGNGYRWTESGSGFILRISHQGETLGMLGVDGIAFPEHKERYLNLALTATEALGLAIANARTYDGLKDIEASLAAERERLAVTLRSIGDGVIATDVVGNVVLMNGVAGTLTGWNPEQAHGRPLREVFNVILGDSGDQAADPVDKVLITGDVVELANDTVLIARDGSRRDITDTAAPILDDEGNILGVVLVFHDVTGQKKVEENLRKMQRAVEQNPCTIVITDLKGAIEYVNPRFSQLSGYTYDEAIGQNPRILKSGEKPSEEYKALWEKIIAGEEWRGEFHNRKKNGELYWESASISPIRNADGIITHYIAVKEDVTERKLIEEERERLVRELEERAAALNTANKELEAFSYSVSHDLRAPLRAVDGFSLALLEDYADVLDEDGKRYLRLVREASQRMAQLIDDLLGLSRVARWEIRRGPVDLAAIATAIGADLQVAQPDRRVDFNVVSGLRANGDARLLRIVLENLLGNAWKFTLKREHAVIEFGATKIDDQATYYIRDNGAGFDMAYSSKLFGAFQRLHSASEFPGTGIGLATVQRIIHRHGGRIWAEGAIDQGATIYFTLP